MCINHLNCTEGSAAATAAYLAINSGDDDGAQSHAEHQTGVEVLMQDQRLKHGRHHQQYSIHVAPPLILLLVLGELDQVPAGTNGPGTYKRNKWIRYMQAQQMDQVPASATNGSGTCKRNIWIRYLQAQQTQLSELDQVPASVTNGSGTCKHNKWIRYLQA